VADTRCRFAVKHVGLSVFLFFSYLPPNLIVLSLALTPSETHVAISSRPLGLAPKLEPCIRTPPPSSPLPPPLAYAQATSLRFFWEPGFSHRGGFLSSAFFSFFSLVELIDSLRLSPDFPFQTSRPVPLKRGCPFSFPDSFGTPLNFYNEFNRQSPPPALHALVLSCSPGPYPLTTTFFLFG